MDLQQLRSWIFELYEPLANERQYVIHDAERGNLLIDVPPFSDRALRLLRGAGRASLLLVTNAGRATDAHRYREALGVQIVAHERDASAVPGGPDVRLKDDELLRPDSRALRMGDATVLIARKAGGVLFCGDLDLASPVARPLGALQFSAVLSARRPPVWSAGRDELLRMHGELPRPRRRFGILLQAPWDRAHRGRLEDQMVANPLIPTDRTTADEAAMGPATLVVARAARDLVERPARPIWASGTGTGPSAAPPASTAGRSRPRNFAEDWSATASPRLSLTIAHQPTSSPVARSTPPHLLAATIEVTGGIDLSPDGTEVLFARGSDAADGPVEICAAPLAEGDRIFQLTDAEARSVAPRWSPDARWIAFLRGLRTDQALHVVDRDGKGERRLSAGPFDDFAWSPDGVRIACGSAGGIRIVEVATGASRALAGGLAPRWSPDGTRLAFTRGAPGARAIHVIPVAGGAETRLEIGAEAWGPEWSPEGTRLSCTVAAGGRTRIAVVTLAATAVVSTQRLGVSPCSELQPQWRADGRGLLYLQDQGAGQVSVRRVFVASQTDTPVADRPGTHAAPRLGPDSESVVYVLANDLWSQPKGAVEPRRIS